MPSTSNWKDGIFLKVCFLTTPCLLLVLALFESRLYVLFSYPIIPIQFNWECSITTRDWDLLSLDRQCSCLLCAPWIQPLLHSYTRWGLQDRQGNVLHAQGLLFRYLVSTSNNDAFLLVDAWPMQVPDSFTSSWRNHLPILWRWEKGNHRWYRMAFPTPCCA